MKIRIIKWIINLGILVGVGILAWTYGPSVLVEANYQEQLKAEEVNEAVEPKKGFDELLYSVSGFEDLIEVNEPFKEFGAEPVSGRFGLVIPKIFANVAVIENVNPGDKEAYQRILGETGGVAHAAGSVVPGELGTTYIFGHSTDASFDVVRFNAVFYLLRKLEAGDLIISYYNNIPHRYKVVEKKVVAPDDIDDIVNVGNEERLVLQTCWPPGTDWRRLLIIAEPEEIERES